MTVYFGEFTRWLYNKTNHSVWDNVHISVFWQYLPQRLPMVETPNIFFLMLGMKKDFSCLHFDLKLSIWVFLSNLSPGSGGRPWGQRLPWWEEKLPLQGCGLTWASKTSPMIDSKMIDQFDLYTHNHLCPTFSLYKQGSIFSTLETITETLVCCLPSVGVTDINSLLFHHHSFLSLGIFLAVLAELGLFGIPGARWSCIPAPAIGTFGSSYFSDRFLHWFFVTLIMG